MAVVEVVATARGQGTLRQLQGDLAAAAAILVAPPVPAHRV